MSDTAILLIIILVPLGLFLLLKINQLRTRASEITENRIGILRLMPRI